MKKFFLGIISHKNSTKRVGQKKALLLQNHPGFDFYYFIGNPGQEEEFVVDESEKVVFLNVPDNYESLPLKTLGIVKFAERFYRDTVEGVLKTDDDIIINLEKIYEKFSTVSEEDYVGMEVNIEISYESTYHFGRCETVEFNYTPFTVPTSKYCAGGGYYLNKRILKTLIDNDENHRKMIFEDVATGKTLNSLGIFPINIDVRNNGFYW